MMMDDHEVDDDWRWIDFNRQHAYIPWWNRIKRFFSSRTLLERRIPREVVLNAFQAYWEHQGMHAPRMVDPMLISQSGQYDVSEPKSGSFSYTFQYGATAFFVMDTRSMRVKGSKGSTILGEGQWRQLERWLLDVRNDCPVKFIVSSSSVIFHMWADIARDRWSGFSRDRDRLLKLISDNDIDGVYILSGDLHAAFVIQAEINSQQGKKLHLWEFCSSPLEQIPNRWAGLTNSTLPSKWIDHQECKFIRETSNFGAVSVDTTRKDRPEVTFQLYDQSGVLLEEVKPD